MKEPRDEFLEQLKNTLLGHEEPYDEGAWERFAAKNISKDEAEKPKPVIPIWKWAAAAAAVLAGAVLLFQYFNAPDTASVLNGDKGSVVQTETWNNSPKDSQTILTDTTKAAVATGSDNNKNNNFSERQFLPAPINKGVFSPNETTTGTAKTLAAPAPPAIAQTQPATQKQQPQPEQKPANKPFWENTIEGDVANKPLPQRDNNPQIAVIHPVENTKKADKGRWQSSLYVSPNFASDGINMGYGYSLGYAVNDKIRISSGVAYTKVSTSKNFNAPDPPNTLATMNAAPAASSFGNTMKASAYIGTASAPHLQSMESWVSGIDVPVEVTYSVNSKLYATGGVSGLFVVRGEDTRKYIDKTNSQVAVVSSQGIVKSYSNLEMKSDPMYQQLPNDKTSFLGFYNVSMGFKQKVAANNSVSVEPFVKIPIKQVSEQKLNYTGVGVRLKFDF